MDRKIRWDGSTALDIRWFGMQRFKISESNSMDCGHTELIKSNSEGSEVEELDEE